MSLFTRVILPVYLLLCSSILSAQPAVFQSGLDAARNGDYQQALQYFLQAREQGMDSGRLYYNIGVSQYKLGHYEAATQAFEQAARDPELQALAYYNLALVANAQHDKATALTWTQRSLASTQDEQLSRLATAMERHLSSKPESGVPSMTTLFSAHSGYDDNVILQADSQLLTASNQGDTFANAFYFARLPLATHGPYNWNIDASIFTQQYLRLHDYDLSMLQTGGVVDRRFSSWRLEGALTAAIYTLAGNGLYRTLTMKATARWRQAKRHWSGFAEISNIDAANAAYDYLGGQLYRSGVSASWRSEDRRRYNVAYTIENNDRQDLTTATTFTSYSPLRQSLDLSVEMDIRDRMSGKLELEGRNSRYRDQNISATASAIQRREQRYRLSAGLTYQLREAVDLTAECRLLSNYSNIDRYDYTDSIVQFGGSIIW